jgi:hypothetical protein
MAEQQRDRVEELKAAGTPRARRQATAAEAELAIVEADLAVDAEPAPVLVVVPAPAEPQTPVAARTRSSSSRTAVAQAVGVMADTTADVPPGVIESAPADDPTDTAADTEAASAVGEGWREFVVPSAARGTSTAGRRINIPISVDLADRLHALDYQLAQEGSRWSVNRNSLLAAAIDALLADPARWEAAYAEQLATLPAAPMTLQGRVSEAQYQDLNVARFTPTGRRATGPLLSLIVADLLG